MAVALKLPRVFSDHMVLERDVPLPVWGEAAAGATVSVWFKGRSHRTRADARGRWRVALPPQPADREAASLRIEATGHGVRPQSVTIGDVRVGQVWLCSGQSNMAMRLPAAAGGERAAAEADLPLIRSLRGWNDESDPPGWRVCTPETATDFGAVPFFFARALWRDEQVPVGLIESAMGGTGIATWTRIGAYDQQRRLKHEIVAGWDILRRQLPDRLPAEQWRAKLDEAGGDHEKAIDLVLNARGLCPGTNYARAIEPIIPYALGGVAWYQGESNAWGFDVAGQYEANLKLMLEDWRRQWGRPDLPLVIVQLPHYPGAPGAPGAPGPRPQEISPWHVVIQAQQRVARQLPRAWTVVSIDLGMKGDIHPIYKEPVGERLARVVRRNVLGRDVVDRGPTLAQAQWLGDRVRLRFDHTQGGLVAAGGKLEGFAVAGADRRFFWAQATLEGDAVICRSDQVPEPAAVRYAMSEGSNFTLCNGAGFPAEPLATDDWPTDLHADPPRRTRAVRATAAPALDGRADAAPWQAAPAATGFTIPHTLRRAEHVTEARLLWDEAHLYAALRCEQDTTRLTTGATGLNDERIWWDDNVQIMIDADRDRMTYHRLVVSAAGAVAFGRAVNNLRTDSPFHCGHLLHLDRELVLLDRCRCEVAVARDAQAWSATVAIPWAALGLDTPPGPGAVMGVQFTRTVGAEDERSEWTATGRDRNTGAMPPYAMAHGCVQHHAVSRFGTLTLEPAADFSS